MRYALLLFTAVGGVALGRPLCQQLLPPTRMHCDKQWTVLIYMNGDNDLSPFTFTDLDEIAKVGSSTDVDIVVQQDTSATEGIKRYHIQRAPTNPSPLATSLLARLPEQDSGAVQTLRDFLVFGVKNYPARHYMIIIWSHGNGYAGGIAPDYSSNSQLAIAELNQALEYLQHVHLQGRKIDIYASDACLMQSLEVIYQLRQRARFIIGSANREQKSGWPYEEIIQYLVNHPQRLSLTQHSGVGADAAYWLAAEIPHLYLRHYFDRDTWATMNTVVAAEVARRDRQSLLSNLQRLSTALRQFLRTDPLLHPLVVLAAVQRAYQFAPAQRDLKTFLGHLQALTAPHTEVHRASAALQAALAQVVLKPAASDPHKHTRYFYSRGFGYGTHAAGLTLWLPLNQNEFTATKDVFATATLLKASGWYALQEELFNPRLPAP